MEPFTIHCSSCQSRIRVRNPNMIGQIANCPKCDSMIMIAAPQQILVDSSSGSPTDSVAVTKEALPMPEQGLLDSNQLFDQGFRSGGLHEPTAPEFGTLETHGIETHGIEAGGLDSISPSAWLPEPTAPPRGTEVAQIVYEKPENKSRQVMIVAAIGACSVLLACGAFFIFLKWVARPSSVVGKQPVVTAPPPQPSLPTELAPAEIAPADMPDQALAASPVDVPDVNGDGTDQPPRVEDNATAAIAAPATAASSTASNVASSTSSNPAVSGANNAGPDTQTDVSLLPGASLASQTPNIDATFDTPAADSDPQAIKETLPPGLQSFASIFDQGLVPVLSDATVPLDAAPTAGDDATPTDAASATGAPLALTLPDVVDQKLARSVSGLLIAKRPLSEVLATLALASEIPFSADLDSFPAAGMDRNLTINHKSTEPMTLAGLLEKISADSGVNFEPFEKKWIVARGDTEKAKSRAATSWPIYDLVGNQEQSEALRAALDELLPELAGQFEIREGALHSKGGELIPLLWFQVGRLLDTWRGLRGIDSDQTGQLVPASSRLPEWPMEAAQALAQKKISQVLLPEPLALSWQRLSNEVGLTCWIDWPALDGAQVSPAQVAMVVSNGRTYQDLIQYYADKYQVLFALEDRQTVWLTTPDMHRFQPRLYVLPRGDKSVEQWRQELAPLTPFSPIDGTGMLRVIPSPDGQFLFIRCCRPLLAEPKA